MAATATYYRLGNGAWGLIRVAEETDVSLIVERYDKDARAWVDDFEMYSYIVNGDPRLDEVTEADADALIATLGEAG